MGNLYDFSDARMSWRSCPGFLFSNRIVNDDPDDCMEEEDWFFPEPKVNVPADITARYKCFSEPKPALPPIIYVSGMDIRCQLFEKVEVDLSKFESFWEFSRAFEHKYIYISVVDADNCDFDLAQDIFDSEEIFDKFLDDYKACL